METAKRFELAASDGAPLIINVDGEAVITTPATMQYHNDQLTVRGAASIPNE
jgi:diacylglycerol kinase family enzyme